MDNFIKLMIQAISEYQLGLADTGKAVIDSVKFVAASSKQATCPGLRSEL